jgi:hypothetical protein
MDDGHEAYFSYLKHELWKQAFYMAPSAIRAKILRYHISAIGTESVLYHTPTFIIEPKKKNYRGKH